MRKIFALTRRGPNPIWEGSQRGEGGRAGLNFPRYAELRCALELKFSASQPLKPLLPSPPREGWGVVVGRAGFEPAYSYESRFTVCRL